MAHSIRVIVILAIVASLVAFGIGIYFSFHGSAVIGGQLVGAGATVLGSAIVGMLVARVSATLSGQIQEEIEARREHKREIDELVEYLENTYLSSIGRIPVNADAGGLAWLGRYLLIKGMIPMTLSGVKDNVRYEILWDDLGNHWPGVKSRAVQLTKELIEHNKKAREFITQSEDVLKKRSALFAQEFDVPFVPGSAESKDRIAKECFKFTSMELKDQAMYILGQDHSKEVSRVDSNELTTMSIPRILEWAYEFPETYGRQSQEVAPAIRDLVTLGKEAAIKEYRNRLAAFLQKTISESTVELKKESELIRLAESKQRLDHDSDEVKKDLEKIKVSKSLPGRCEWVRVQ